MGRETATVDRNATEADATLLAAVADPVRLALLHRLAADSPRCVCDLQPEPAIPANLLSYHLRVLREAGIAAYGVMSTPGLVVDGTVVVSGRVPRTAEIVELLTAR